MDTIHEAHLSRILEARRRRGVLGEYTAPVAAPPPRARYADPPPPPPQPAPRRDSSSAATQTAEERKTSAAAQTRPGWRGDDAAGFASRPMGGSAPYGAADWRQSVPRNGGPASAAPPVAPPSPYATQDGAVRFQSPGRVPSLVYTTPATSPRRHSTPRQPSVSATPLMPAGRRSVEPLPPPLYIPRAHTAPRDPLYLPASFTPHVPRRSSPLSSRPYDSHGGGSWQGSFPSQQPSHVGGWRSRLDGDRVHSNFGSGVRFSPLSIHRDDDYGASSGPPLMAWQSPRRSPRHDLRSASPRQSKHHSHHHSRHRSRKHRSSSASDDADGEVEFPPRRRGSKSATRPRSQSRHRSQAWQSPETDVRRGRGYAPPVVYMGDAGGGRGSSPLSADGRRRRGRSASPSSRQRRSPTRQRPVEEQRKFALGLPDARSTMDLRTSIETLRAGDWFYKWSAKGDVVSRRWVWVDTKSYLLAWSNRETRNTNFCGDIRLDHICQVTSRDLTSVDEDGFPKTYYVLLIETTKRVLQLATELKDKCDAWFEALNNVMGFIHRNDISKGALMPD